MPLGTAKLPCKEEDGIVASVEQVADYLNEKVKTTDLMEERQQETIAANML